MSDVVEEWRIPESVERSGICLEESTSADRGEAEEEAASSSQSATVSECFVVGAEAGE